MLEILRSEIFWLYASIPITSSFVGWFTNWVAIKMTFYPLEFMGLFRPFGWQGIIPSKSRQMGEKAVDLIASKLLKVEEVFDRIEPKIVSQEMKKQLTSFSKNVIDEAMETEARLVWEATPQFAKELIYTKTQIELPRITEAMMKDIKNNIHDLFDLKQMVAEHLDKDKKLLNEIFLKCGEKEFRFIEYSGFYFGFLLGVPQMILWYFYPHWLVLPLAGIVVGYMTNWLALKMIFEPSEPLKIGSLHIQGLFLKRQNEVSNIYAKLVTERILTSEKIFERIVTGPNSYLFEQLAHRHVKQTIDNTLGISKIALQAIGGTNRYVRLKEIAAQRFIEDALRLIKPIYGYTDQVMQIKNSLQDKMSKLSSKEFEGFLRPIFQEDEWKLVLLGAILGGLVGVWQVLYLFKDVVRINFF